MQEEALRTSCRISDKGEVAAARGDYAFILTLYLCVQVWNCSNYIAPGMCITDTSILKIITLCQSSYKGLDRKKCKDLQSLDHVDPNYFISTHFLIFYRANFICPLYFFLQFYQTLINKRICMRNTNYLSINNHTCKFVQNKSISFCLLWFSHEPS